MWYWFCQLYVQIVRVLSVVVNMQFGMQVIPAQWQYGFSLIYQHNGKLNKVKLLYVALA